jgi:hypothetical protein
VQERRNRRLSARANRMFLTTVGAVVLLGLAGTLLWAHGFIPGLEGVRPPAPPEPANAGANGAETTDNANRAEPPGNEAPPEQPPEEAPQDDYMPHERAWELVEGALLQAGRDRREARYDGAVQALDAVLGREDLPPLPHRRLQQERSLTQAMARAWFEREMARAQSMAEDGRPDDATRTYRQIAAHVGIPELAQQARRAADRTPNTP